MECLSFRIELESNVQNVDQFQVPQDGLFPAVGKVNKKKGGRISNNQKGQLTTSS